MKSPKFLAQVNSKNKKYNDPQKENFNLPQLSSRRICFQKLIERECDQADSQDGYSQTQQQTQEERPKI